MKGQWHSRVEEGSARLPEERQFKCVLIGVCVAVVLFALAFIVLTVVKSLRSPRDITSNWFSAWGTWAGGPAIGDRSHSPVETSAPVLLTSLIDWCAAVRAEPGVGESVTCEEREGLGPVEVSLGVSGAAVGGNCAVLSSGMSAGGAEMVDVPRCGALLWGPSRPASGSCRAESAVEDARQVAAAGSLGCQGSGMSRLRRAVVLRNRARWSISASRGS